MTAGTECVSVAAGKPTVDWLMWHCQEVCSITVPLRPCRPLSCQICG